MPGEPTAPEKQIWRGVYSTCKNWLVVVVVFVFLTHLLLKDKGHDENHNQLKCSIFHHIFNRQYLVLLTNPLRKLLTNSL